ncbi:MAG: hypothetical protein ACR2HV_11825 [Acidimicrobiales bacterium]
MNALLTGGAVVLALVTSVPPPSVRTAGPVTSTPFLVYGAASAATAPDPGPLERARIAAATLTCTGVVDVVWDDAAGHHFEQLSVRAARGTLHVEGGSALKAEAGGARMVRRPGGDWDLLWSGIQSPSPRPNPEEKYELATVTGPEPARVASRPTDLVEVREGAAVRERHFLDTGTQLLLRRERLDTNGRVTRVVAFSSIDFKPEVDVPPSPSRVTDHSPRRMARVSSPATLPGGYHRVDAYKEKRTEQVVYSDGLYDLSVFRQRGSLAAGDLPSSGTPVQVGSGRGWLYSWPGGQVLVWRAGHNVYSLVSEAPVDHLVAAAGALPKGGSSLVDRMRRVCRNLLEPLSA